MSGRADPNRASPASAANAGGFSHLASLAATVILACAPIAASAQRPDALQDRCYRFRFGQWRPALDWARAGHAPDRRLGQMDPRSEHGARGDAGRYTATDTSVVLYPSWWPAGVLVEWATPDDATDSLPGTARALVANGTEPPRATVVVWWVKCEN